MLLRDSDISEEEGECGVLGLFKVWGADKDTEQQGGDTERARLESGGGCRRGSESGCLPSLSLSLSVFLSLWSHYVDLAGLELTMYTSLA